MLGFDKCQGCGKRLTTTRTTSMGDHVIRKKVCGNCGNTAMTTYEIIGARYDKLIALESGVTSVSNAADEQPSTPPDPFADFDVEMEHAYETETP